MEQDSRGIFMAFWMGAFSWAERLHREWMDHVRCTHMAEDKHIFPLLTNLPFLPVPITTRDSHEGQVMPLWCALKLALPVFPLLE